MSSGYEGDLANYLLTTFCKCQQSSEFELHWDLEFWSIFDGTSCSPKQPRILNHACNQVPA